MAQTTYKELAEQIRELNQQVQEACLGGATRTEKIAALESAVSEIRRTVNGANGDPGLKGLKEEIRSLQVNMGTHLQTINERIDRHLEEHKTMEEKEKQKAEALAIDARETRAFQRQVYLLLIGSMTANFGTIITAVILFWLKVK